jgi:hypothetical protein
MLDLSFIGIVDFASAGTAWLSPVASFEGDNLPEALDDVAEMFPERGKVTWFHCPSGTDAGSLWTFRIRESPTFGNSPKHTDRYMVEGTPTKLNRRVLCSFETEEEARTSLTAGIDLTIESRDKHFIRIAKTSLIGPVPLVVSPDGYATLDRAAQDSPIGINPLAKHQIVTLDFNGIPAEIIWPPNSSWRNEAEVDWGSDQNVLGRALKCVAKLAAPEVIAALQLTSKAIAQISSTVGTSKLKPIDVYRLERATALISEIGPTSDWILGLEAELIQLPQNLISIDRAKRAAVEEATEAVKATEAQVLGDKRAQRIRLEAEIEALTNELNNAAEEHAQAQRELSDFYSNLDKSLSDKLAEVERQPGKLIADSVILKSVLRNFQSSESVPTRTYLRSSRGDRDSNIKFTSLAQLTANLQAWAAYNCVPVLDVLVLAASILGGCPTVIAGENREIVLETIRSSMFGSSSHSRSVTIHPGQLSPLDVIKDVELLFDQSSSEPSLRLVILDGVNRTSSESVVAPFLARLDGDALRARLGASTELGLVTTLSDSSLTLPVAKKIWDCTNVHLLSTTAQVEGTLADIPLSGVCNHSILEGFRIKKHGSWRELAKTLSPSLRVNADQAHRADQFQHALTTMGLEPLAVIGKVFECSLATCLAVCPQEEVSRFFEIAGFEGLSLSQQRVQKLLKEEGSCTIQ